ncbi:hypothetical protein BKA57DRAFT_537426, partial [Linnemannia elongata]
PSPLSNHSLSLSLSPPLTHSLCLHNPCNFLSLSRASSFLLVRPRTKCTGLSQSGTTLQPTKTNSLSVKATTF